MASSNGIRIVWRSKTFFAQTHLVYFGFVVFFFLVVSSCFSRVGALFSEAIVMDIGSQMSIVDERNPHTKEETN